MNSSPTGEGNEIGGGTGKERETGLISITLAGCGERIRSKGGDKRDGEKAGGEKEVRSVGGVFAKRELEKRG